MTMRMGVSLMVSPDESGPAVEGGGVVAGELAAGGGDTAAGGSSVSAHPMSPAPRSTRAVIHAMV